MDNAQAPPREKLVGSASELVPLLQANALWTEENRRLHEESIEALADAGLFKMRVPKRYGGYEVDARTVVEVLTQLGSGCGSTSWNVGVWSITGWIACLFPDNVQDEVFATPNVRVCGTLSPTATATPVPGGAVVDGEWHFISGALHSHWQAVVAIMATPDGQPLPVFALVPLPELEIVDDWHAAGLRGTGSVTTVAKGVFVPDERILPLPLVLQEQYASQRNAAAPIYRAPLLPTAAATSVGTAVGLAFGAREAFLERLPGRKIAYTNYPSQREAPLTHLRVAEAIVRADGAEFHALRLADQLDAKVAAGDAWTVEERARARADLGRACQLAKEAVDILNQESGGSSIFTNVSIQRFERDIQAINLHALMHPNTNLELYGRILCDLPPNTLYL